MATLAELLAETARYRAETAKLCKAPLLTRIAAFLATNHAGTRLVDEYTIFGPTVRLAVVTVGDHDNSTAGQNRLHRADELCATLRNDAEAVALALAVPAMAEAA